MLLFSNANPRWEADGIIFAKSNLHLLPRPPSKITIDTLPIPAAVAKDIAWDDDDAFIKDEKDESLADKQLDANLQIPAQLPDETMDKDNDNEPSYVGVPVAIFAQTPNQTGANNGLRIFQFIGYYRIIDLQFLAPHSIELEGMLVEKWTITNKRTGSTQNIPREGEKWQESRSKEWAVVRLEREHKTEDTLGTPQVPKLKGQGSEAYRGKKRMSSAKREKKSVRKALQPVKIKDERNDIQQKLPKNWEEQWDYENELRGSMKPSKGKCWRDKFRF